MAFLSSFAALRLAPRLALLGALLLGLQAPAVAQPLELSVKAAFLPKFARYVEWPSRVRPAAGEPLQLCIVGDDPFGRVIDTAASDERVAVRRIGSASQAASCHIAFVRGASARSTAQMVAALEAYPILTVTDSRYGSARGMIHFAISGGRVGFHIDNAKAQGSNLAISSRLLQLALSVKQR